MPTETKTLSTEDTHNTPSPHHETQPERYREVAQYSQAPPVSGEADSGYDFKSLLLFFWEKRTVIGAITGAFLVWGILVAILSPVEYQASGTFLPESPSSGGVANTLLRQYGGLFGINSQGGGGGGLPPSLYPDIIQSVPYQVELMNVPITFSERDTTVTAHQYFRDLHPTPKTDYLYRYTVGLPWTVWGWIRGIFSGGGSSSGGEATQVAGSEPVLEDIDRDTVISLTGPQKSTIGELRGRITVVQQGMLVSLTAEFPDPRAAAEIGRAGIEMLKDYVTQYRTRKAQEELQFVRQQVEEARTAFEEAQRELAEFQDSNVQLSTAKSQIRLQQLQSTRDLRFNIYNTLAQNLEQARMRVEEDTPVFTTVEPFQIPGGSSKPKTQLIIIMYLVIGLAVSCIWVLLRRQWDELVSFARGGSGL